jgi:dynactin complex subunit
MVAPVYSEISTIIGELRAFVAQQVVTNGQVLNELKSISDRVAQYAEINATFIEYRKTLHARLEKIHDQTIQFDDSLDRMDARVSALHDDNIRFKFQIKIVLAVMTLLATVGSTIVTGVLSPLFRAIK